MSAGETVLDLPRLRICLDRVQVVIMKCMSRNARWTTGVKRVNTILQHLVQSANLWTADKQDSPNLRFQKSALDHIHDDPFWLLSFDTSLIYFHWCPIGMDFVDPILADFGNDLFQCVCLPTCRWSTLPPNHDLMGTPDFTQSTWYMFGSQC